MEIAQDIALLNGNELIYIYRFTNSSICRSFSVIMETLSTTDAKELLRLCKLGRLFDVQNWIASGTSLCVPDDLRTYPLKVALYTGFHSLVELLVRTDPQLSPLYARARVRTRLRCLEIPTKQKESRNSATALIYLC